jgi:hypothetical protein
MPKRPKDHDFVTVARRVVEQAIGEQLDGSPLEPPKTKHGRAIGGSKGGFARAKSLTQAQKREIAKKAALARWKSQKGG